MSFTALPGRRRRNAAQRRLPSGRLDHDWFYHLPGHEYDAIRQTLAGQLGLANRPGSTLPP